MGQGRTFGSPAGQREAAGAARQERIEEGSTEDAAMPFGWPQLLDLDSRLHEERGIRLLTPEARVLIHLKLNGPASVTSAMNVAGTSYRGFYAVLERLRRAGIIDTVRDAHDQRVRRLNLDSSVSIVPSQS